VVELFDERRSIRCVIFRHRTFVDVLARIFAHVFNACFWVGFRHGVLSE